MSLHYLLDGYNVLKQIPAFRDLPLEDGRRGLLGWIDHSRPQGSVNNQLTVVFDGSQDQYSFFPGVHNGGSNKSQDIRVIFSDGCSADDQIKFMVEQDADKKNCVVVSNDKGIFLYARSLGAKIMSVEAFVRAGRQSAPRPPRRGDPSDEKHISLSRQEKINEELKGFWLKENQ